MSFLLLDELDLFLVEDLDFFSTGLLELFVAFLVLTLALLELLLLDEVRFSTFDAFGAFFDDELLLPDLTLPLVLRGAELLPDFLRVIVGEPDCLLLLRS